MTKHVSIMPPMELVKFGIVGAANTAVDFFCFWAFVTFSAIPPLIANTVSYSLGGANSFILNRFWTFRRTAYRHGPARQLRAFVLVSAASLMFSNATLWIAAFVLPLLYAKGVSILGTFFFNYFASRHLVFRALQTE